MNLSKTSIVGRKTMNENINQQMTLLFSNLTGQWITIYCVKSIMLDNRGHKRYWRQYSTHFHGNYSIIKETDPHQTTLLLATSGQLISSLSERNIEKKLFQKWAKKNLGGGTEVLTLQNVTDDNNCAGKMNSATSSTRAQYTPETERKMASCK